MIVGSLITIAWDSGGSIVTDSIGRLWKRPDGSALSINDYPDLFNVIGDRYGSSVPGVDFKLPDFKSRFLRGWDPTASVDVDAASRTIPGPGATSADAGSVQAENYMPHTHPLPIAFLLSPALSPGGDLVPGNGFVRVGPAAPVPAVTATTISSSTNTTFGPSTEILPYHVVVDLLVRIK